MKRDDSKPMITDLFFLFFKYCNIWRMGIATTHNNDKKKDRKKGQNKKINANEKKQRKKKTNMLIIRDYEEHLLKNKQTKTKTKWEFSEHMLNKRHLYQS